MGINIMVDTTLGVGVEYALLLLLLKMTSQICSDCSEDLHTGEYYDVDGRFITIKYMKQLMLWILVVSGMKLSMVVLMVIFSRRFPIISSWQLQTVASTVLRPFMSSPASKLLVVMIVTPV